MHARTHARYLTDAQIVFFSLFSFLVHALLLRYFNLIKIYLILICFFCVHRAYGSLVGDIYYESIIEVYAIDKK